VYHVKAEQNRYLQTRFERGALQFIGHPRAAHVERRTEQSFPRQFQMFGTIFAVSLAVQLLKLSEFFG
jgi:hypothetical protein